MGIYCNISLKEGRKRNVEDERCRGSQNTRFVFNYFFPPLIVSRDNVLPYGRAGPTADDNMAHALCMLDT